MALFSSLRSQHSRFALLLALAAAGLVSAVPFGCGAPPAASSFTVDAAPLDAAIEEPAAWEHGANLVVARGCPACHDSADPATVLAGSDQPIAGSEAYGANLTPDPATGIGRWTDGQLAQAIVRGVAADGRTLCAQMPRAADMSDADVAAIAGYLRTLPPVVHAVPASVCPGSPAGRGDDDDDDDDADGADASTRGTPPPSPGALLISEVMCDPLGPEPTDEWFELHNPSGAAVALRSLTITDEDGRSVQIGEAPDLSADGYALFARTREGASAQQLPAPTFVYGEGVGATSGVVLTNDSKGSLSIFVGDVLIDHFAYGGSPRRVAGSSIERIAAADGGATGCTATTSWGSDAGLGTPAAPNDCP